MTKTITVTKRFEVYIVNNLEHQYGRLSEEEERQLRQSRNEQYQFLRNEMYWQNRAMNDLMNFMWAKLRYRDDIKLLDESYLEKKKKYEERVDKLSNEIHELNKNKENNKKKIEKLNKSLTNAQNKLKKMNEAKSREATDTLSKALGQTMQTIERDYLMKRYYPDKIMRTSTIDRITSAVRSDFNNQISSVLRGEETIINYKRDNPLMFRGGHITFTKSDTGYYASLYGITFKIKLPRRKNAGDLTATLDKMIDGEYKICDSMIQNKNNKWYLLMSIQQEISTDYQPVKNRVLGIDMGIAVPAYVALNDKTYVRKAFGSADEFLRVRQQFKKRRERLQNQLQLAKGGKGRKDKLSAFDSLREKESNFAQTYNHQLSKKIVDFAVKHNVETIHMENLTKDGFDDRLLANWSYYQLRQYIEYKAKRYGIKVKLVNPAYTSQKCSKCGHIDKENRPKKDKGQAYFKCIQCGNKMNADHNAAINIARSNDIGVDDISENIA